MKKLFMVLSIVLIFAIPVLAVDLVSDPCTGCTTYDMEINGAIVGTELPLEADLSIKYNVDGLTIGTWSFRARCYSAEGWPTGWSVPFGATKPGSPSNVRLQR